MTNGTKTFEEHLQDIIDLRDDIQEARELITEEFGDPDYDQNVTVVTQDDTMEDENE